MSSPRFAHHPFVRWSPHGHEERFLILPLRLRRLLARLPPSLSVSVKEGHQWRRGAMVSFRTPFLHIISAVLTATAYGGGVISSGCADLMANAERTDGMRSFVYIAARVRHGPRFFCFSFVWWTLLHRSGILRRVLFHQLFFYTAEKRRGKFVDDATRLGWLDFQPQQGPPDSRATALTSGLIVGGHDQKGLVTCSFRPNN